MIQTDNEDSALVQEEAINVEITMLEEVKAYNDWNARITGFAVGISTGAAVAAIFESVAAAPAGGGILNQHKQKYYTEIPSKNIWFSLLNSFVLSIANASGGADGDDFSD